MKLKTCLLVALFATRGFASEPAPATLSGSILASDGSGLPGARITVLASPAATVPASIVASGERGLYLVAKALERIPGGKSMFFLGWGLHVNRAPADWKWHALAVNALQVARVNVFTLDVSDADWHTLEGTLQKLADLTGGTYAKTHVFSSQALDLAFRAIEGRYVVIFNRPDRPPGRHAIELSLRTKKGRVLARPFYDDP